MTDFTFTEEQGMIASSVLALSDNFRDSKQNTAGRCAVNDFGRALTSAGMTTMLVPDADGEAAAGLVELGVALETLGRTLAPYPLADLAGLAVDILTTLPESAATWSALGAVRSGETYLPLLPSPCRPATISETDGYQRLDGIFTNVWCPPWPSRLLVVASEPKGDSVWLLPSDVAAEQTEINQLDRTRRFATFRFDGVDLAGSEQLGTLPEERRLRPHAVRAALTAVESLGGAARLLELACAHAREREQFGQPIGKFQAIKHMLADNATLIEGLRSLAYGAICQLTTEDAPSDAWGAALLARTVYERLADNTIQVFGAMGFAAETEPHRYLKRAQADRSIGLPDASYRHLIAEAVLGPVQTRGAS